MSSDVTIRYVGVGEDLTDDEINDETRRIFRFLVALHQEAGAPEDIAAFDHAKALMSMKECITDGIVIAAEIDGELVGIIGLMEYDIWYSQASMLAERFFYIRPEYRDGSVFAALLAELRAIANDLGIVSTITIANMQKTKAKRPPRNQLERVASAFTYIPRGAVYQIAPARDAS